MRANDLWRGDIILTSMKLRLGTGGVVSTLAPAIENSAINIATSSVYSHAMLVVGPSKIAEFRNNMKVKSLREALTEGGKNQPAVAHVFRHKKSNGPNREKLMAEATKNFNAFKAVNMDYVMRVWLGFQEMGVRADREEVRGMMVCSTFVTSTYFNAGLPLRPGNPHNMTSGDISLCADQGRLRSVSSARDMHAVWWSFMRRQIGGMKTLPPGQLNMPGVICPSEYE